MPVPSKFSHEVKLRIKSVETLDMIKQIYETEKNKSINSILNRALEKGLPLLLGDTYSVNPKEIANQVAEKVLARLDPLASMLSFNMKKITVLQTVQESMLGSLIQEFEFFLKTKGLEMDPTLLEEFRISLPDRFEHDKQDLIERLFDAVKEEESADDE